MKRVLETPGECLTTKRQRPSYLDLSSYLKPCLLVSPVKTTVNWSSLRRHLCLSPKPSTTGEIWYFVFTSDAKNDFQISAIFPDGRDHEVVQSVAGQPGRFDPRENECLFIDSESKQVRCVSTNGCVSVLVADHCIDYRCYTRGIITLLPERDRKVAQRRDTKGILLDTFEFDIPIWSWDVIGQNGDDIVTTTNSTSIEIVNIWSKRMTSIAGSKVPGLCDGHGAVARFQRLKMPISAYGDAVIVRDILCDGTSRTCVVDCKTHKVTTLTFRGLKNDFDLFGPTSYNLLFLSKSCELFHANINEDIHVSTFLADMRGLDWSGHMQVTFRLADGSEVNADRRILCARSKYFAAMLGPSSNFKEAQDSVVDISSSSVDGNVFRTVLTYLITDELDLGLTTGSGASGELFEHALFCLKVATVADLYQLQRLVGLADAFVTQVALPKHDEFVLPLLEHSFGTGGAVEQACWQVLSSRPKAVCSWIAYEELVKLLTRSPELGAKLLLHIAGLVPVVQAPEWIPVR